MARVEGLGMGGSLIAGRFAVLEHSWNGVHWDFLLEDGETLRAWAIDAAIVPGIVLPARALPPHRRIYLEYEGPVSGNRGTVRRVAEGTFRALEWTAQRVRLVLAGGQLVGEVILERAEAAPAADSSSYPAVEAEPWKFRLGNVD